MCRSGEGSAIKLLLQTARGGIMTVKMRFDVARFFAVCLIALSLSSIGWSQTEQILHTFTGPDGSTPWGGVTADSQGNIYGTASAGGALGCCGTVFELSPGLDGTWTEKLIYDLSLGEGVDGYLPYGGLVFDSKGNLYGSTLSGGTYFGGVVFQLSPAADGTWTEKVLYNFTGGADGGSLFACGLTVDAAGNIYGNSDGGGAYGYGAIFEIVPGPNGTFTEKVIHSFKGGNDGTNPYSNPVIIDAAGRIYGATAGGGAHDFGIVYELTPQSNGTWAEKIIYNFTGQNGLAGPFGGLVMDSAGNLYSTFNFGVFELMQQKDGSWKEETLYRFTGSPDGAYPEGLTFDKSGNLYGTTNTGGEHRGTVFELSPGANGSWSERVLHRFQPNGIDGIFPQFGPVAIDSSGNVYGSVPQGGTAGQGVVFEITK
jgi:uncharacterized repeat protein (TIGR03803 family)